MRIYEDVDMDAPEMVSAKEKLDALVEELKSAGTSKVSFTFCVGAVCLCVPSYFRAPPPVF